MRSQKEVNILDKAKCLIAAGKYLDTRHAQFRQQQRNISLVEIKYVIYNGYHEKRKDEYKSEWNAWNYAIRGRTIDHRELRVIVSVDDPINLLIITAIDLKK